MIAVYYEHTHTHTHCVSSDTEGWGREVELRFPPPSRETLDVCCQGIEQVPKRYSTGDDKTGATTINGGNQLILCQKTERVPNDAPSK